MADRYTEKDAIQCGKRLADTLGKKFGNCLIKEDGNKWVIGCWDVDYNPIYGGAVIDEIANEDGGITKPFGAMRLKPREFCDTVWFAEEAIKIQEKKQSII
jgi:hypothetical protein